MLDVQPPHSVAAIKADTPIENQVGTPEEIADFVSALAGEDGSWISGQVISATGVSGSINRRTALRGL